MKKSILLFIAFFGLFSGINAQVVITNSTFPEAGDVLRTEIVGNYTNFDVQASGSNQVWDMRDLPSGTLVEVEYLSPSEGEASDLFPTADLMENSGPQEIYYEVFNDRVVEIGRAGLDPVLNLIDLTFNNSGELILRRAPLEFGSMYDNAGGFRLDAPVSVIPDTLVPGLSTFADSLRLQVDIEVTDEIDGWGQLRLPDGDYDVLRQKRTNTTTASISIKTVFFGWQPLDPTIFDLSALGDAANLLGEVVNTNYQFFANDEKEILADVLVDTLGNVVTVSYKSGMTSSTSSLSAVNPKIEAYPNPSYGRVTFRHHQNAQDAYRLEIYNLIGRVVKSERFNPGQNELLLDLSDLHRGMYMYSIINDSGRKLATKRLLLVRP